MPALTLYGSNVADGVSTSACDMAPTGGGAETSVQTLTTLGRGIYGEVTALGGTVDPFAYPHTPTMLGWVYRPGNVTMNAGNWSGVTTISSVDWGGSSAHANITLQLWKISNGINTPIGTIVASLTGTAKTTYTFAATAMPAVTFVTGDLLYVALWWFDDNQVVKGDNPTIYVSNSAVAGVANDMQVTTSSGLVLYGSGVADGTITTAGAMSDTLGGVETSKLTVLSTNTSMTHAELCSQTGHTTGSFVITSPTGRGWVFSPGAGAFANANWSAIVTVAALGWGGAGNSDLTIQFFKFAAGVYSSIGSLVVAVTGTAKTAYSFTAASMPATTFGASDLLYVAVWWRDAGGTIFIQGDNPTVYVSTSAAAGVTNDVSVTTSTFTATPSSKQRISDGYGGVFS